MSNNEWRNLAPNLVRQRLIIEANTIDFIDNPELISSYLKQLSALTGMVTMRDPIVYSAHEDGYGAWQHWKTSGASFYSYPARNGDLPLITLDCYTCKPFETEIVVNFTKDFFNVTDIVYKEV